ncbi:MAG TPA: thioesterase family protein [Streptosporangiaceae bacterium]|jgi:acyl-CoA thioesterase
MSTTFERATAVRRAGDGVYDVELDAAYSMGGPLHGGYLMATLLRAALADSPHPHPVANGFHFLRTPRPGPARVRVERLKSGRTAATARATLIQDDQVVLDSLVSAGTLDPVAEPDWLGEPPEIAPIEKCEEPWTLTPDGPPGLAGQVEFRHDPETSGWLRGEPLGRPEMRGYVRMREQPQDPDPYVLAVATDAMPPIVFGIGKMGWAPTVELTWHMRAVPAPGWLAIRVVGRMVADGWFDEDVELWDSTGRLVAQARQMARVGR